MVQLNCYWNRDERYYKKGGWKGTQDLDGGTLFTQFSHWIDLLYWIFGDMKDIQAKFNDFNHSNLTEFEDSGFVNFNFVNVSSAPPVPALLLPLLPPAPLLPLLLPALLLPAPSPSPSPSK